MAVAAYDPKKKYVKVGVLKDGKLTHVMMDASRAAALRKRRAQQKATAAEKAKLAETSQLIPKPYRGYVDPTQISTTVDAQIGAVNKPLEQGKTEAQAQFERNAAASASLDAQTQASLDTLVQNANARTSGFQQLAGQSMAALQGSNDRAAAAIGNALGAAAGPQVQGQVQAGTAAQQAQDYAGGVQDTWAGTLASGAQRDFFERGKGISSITQQAFTQGQRQQLTDVLGRIGAQIAANLQRRPELIANAAKEAAQFAFEKETAAAALQQQNFENGLALTDAETDRIAAENRGSGSGGSGAMTEQGKLIIAAKKAIDAMVSQTRKPTTITRPVLDENGKPMTDNNGKPITTTVTELQPVSQVFGNENGPWREAFTRLTAPEIGLSADQAAQFATRWYRQSISNAKPANVKKLLDNRGVSASVQRSIIVSAFGKKAWDLLVGRSPGAATANDPNRTQGTYMPANTSGNVSLWADKVLADLKGKKFKPPGGSTYVLRGFRAGSGAGHGWEFTNPNGISVFVPARANQAPGVALALALKNGTWSH